ncbi:hypothetical protein KK083_26365 [Fulvivirgaceae bacterium PWU4]|uniref:Uncharacterized protein n=1 Tax=Chryseosolibacter histidini TaxID=2782349 RepID=A0AAP2DTR4_9BACT|nr:hypothetical protein [Chryseosolibacter histidini]MBT1700439.1 hypothetical protein [Chryseosolibacter histidini]
MSWINPDSGSLINTDDAISFAEKNHLASVGNSDGAYFTNGKILIHLYEEKSYLHADYYDLKNSRWQRELQTEIVELEIPNIEKRRELVASFASPGGVLSRSSMQRFRFILYAIDRFMQDFLSGDFTRYESFFKSLKGKQKEQIEKIAANTRYA